MSNLQHDMLQATKRSKHKRSFSCYRQIIIYDFSQLQEHFLLEPNIPYSGLHVSHMQENGHVCSLAGDIFYSQWNKYYVTNYFKELLW